LVERFTIATYHSTDRAPIVIVAMSGVWKRGWIRPNTEGKAPWRAIEKLVRAVGRIVVCVEADAELSTAMISSLSSGEPSTACARPPPKTSLELADSASGPANACAAVVTSR
jgi:hypothetical protein